MYKFTPTEIEFRTNTKLAHLVLEGFHNPFSSKLISEIYQPKVWLPSDQDNHFISFDLENPTGDLLVGRGKDGDVIVLFLNDEEYYYAISYTSRYGDFTVMRTTEPHVQTLIQLVHACCKRFDFLDELQRIWPANIMPNGHYNTKDIHSFNHLRNTMCSALRTICGEKLAMPVLDGFYQIPKKLGSATLPSDS
jgi:hypothetical protein